MIRVKATICRPKPQTNRHAVTFDGGILPFAPRLTRQPTLGSSEFFHNFTRQLIPEQADQKEPRIQSLSRQVHCKRTIVSFADHCDVPPLFSLRITGLMPSSPPWR